MLGTIPDVINAPYQTVTKRISKTDYRMPYQNTGLVPYGDGFERSVVETFR